MSISLIFDTQEELNLFLRNKEETIISYSGLRKLNIEYDKCQDKITKLSEENEELYDENERLKKELFQKNEELLQSNESYSYLTANYTSIYNENERLREELLNNSILTDKGVELKSNEEEIVYDFVDDRSDLYYKGD